MNYKLDKERKQDEAFDQLQRRQQRDEPYFSSTLFYGHQQNQFPKRQDHVKEQIKEEIEKQR